MDRKDKVFKEILKANVHDLRNYLSPIVLYSEFIKDSVKDKEIIENCDVILEKSDQLFRHLEALRLLYSDYYWYEKNFLRELLEKLLIVLSPIFREKSKILSFRYIEDEKFILKEEKGKPEELLLQFYGHCQKNDSNCLMVLVYRENDGSMSFNFIEKNLLSIDEVEALRSISKEEAKEEIKSGKVVSCVKW